MLEEALDPLRCSVLLKRAEAFATSTVFPELDNLVRQSNEKFFQVAPQSVPAKRGPGTSLLVPFVHEPDRSMPSFGKVS